jgi:hypothetical protein
MLCQVMSCYVTYVMSCYVMLCYVKSCHVMLRMSCHVMLCHVMSCHVMSCHVMSCYVMSCHVMSCHVMSCHVMPAQFLLLFTLAYSLFLSSSFSFPLLPPSFPVCSPLLLSQPLPTDIEDNTVKAQEAVSLRMLPLSSLLSYSQDDSNERIFEASVAAEMLRSVIRYVH